jgi:outer membrane protein assembly factor BamA
LTGLIRILFLCLISICQLELTAQQLVAVDFQNLRRTNPEFLLNCLDIELGQKVDSIALEKCLQDLRNLNLFLTIDASMVLLDSSNVKLVFNCKESNYTYPIFSIGGFDQKLNLSLGAGDINFRGRAESFGFLYQYYDRHSLRLYHSSLFLGSSKFGHDLSLGKLSTVEPLYFNDRTNLFNFDNYHASLGVHYWFTRHFRIGMGGMFMYERYVNRGEDVLFDGFEIRNNRLIEFFKYQVRAYAQWNKINFLYERRSGFQNTLFGETITTVDYEDLLFTKVTNELKYYALVGKRGAVNLRNRIGISSNNEGPFSPFVIDGFVNIRGSGDRVARGTGEVILNAEYTHTIVDHDWFYLMTNTFVDIGYLRPPGGSFDFNPQNNSNAFYYSGMGLKIQSKKFYNSLIRLDYGFNINNIAQSGFIFGFGNFF